MPAGMADLGRWHRCDPALQRIKVVREAVLFNCRGMTCLQAADHGVEQVAAAVIEKPIGPYGLDLERDVEPSGSADERSEDGPPVGCPLRRLL